MVSAFALRYHRLHAAGERFDFDIEEAPEFVDFVSMAVMVSLGTTLDPTAGRRFGAPVSAGTLVSVVTGRMNAFENSGFRA